MDITKKTYTFDDLKTLMQRLRNPNNGCPWDIEQTFETIKPHTIEEAYEVADAIERNNMHDLKDELGDLLFQIIFHAQMASEANVFTLDDVIDHVTKKMIFRHPHVFGDAQATNADDVKNNIWEQQKIKEKQTRDNVHVLDDVTANLPSLLYAHKLQKKARKTGFKYNNINDVFDKISEEIQELKEAILSKQSNRIEDEFGDVLLVAALLGAHLDINPENALRQASHKFKNRFNAMEDYLKQTHSKTISECTIAELLEAWKSIKAS